MATASAATTATMTTTMTRTATTTMTTTMAMTTERKRKLPDTGAPGNLPLLALGGFLVLAGLTVTRRARE